MLLKWSEEEDAELARIIRKYGTSDWALVRKHFRSNRSRDSVIKRWHGKLKYERPIEPEKTKKIVSAHKNDAPAKRIRRSRKFTVNPRRRENRPNANQPRSSRSRFERLRKFIESSKAQRTKRIRGHSEEKVQNRVESSSSSESSPVNAKHAWSKNDDDKLLALVLQENVTNWERIGNELGCSAVQAKSRWQHTIYNTIKLDDKVGGFHKYSIDQDNILSIGYRNGLDWGEIMTFLPGRTEFSIQARWRRMLRPELQIEPSKNKHYFYRQFLKKIIQKKRGGRQMVEEQSGNDHSPK